jgi:hypothetical protein
MADNNACPCSLETYDAVCMASHGAGAALRAAFAETDRRDRGHLIDFALQAVERGEKALNVARGTLAKEA